MSGLQSLLDKHTYNEYLRRLDARALLEHYGAQNCTEQSNYNDGSVEVVHSCLLDRVDPHHTNGDQNPSASCNIDKKQYVCYSLGFGCDLFHLVMKLEGKESLAEAMGVVGGFLTGSTLSTQAFREEFEKAFQDTNAYSLDLPSYDPSVLNNWLDMPHDYWASRNISEGAQGVLKLGFDPTSGRVVFPHFVQDTLVGWQKRVVPGVSRDEFPKYKNSPGFPKSETLYNFDRAAQFDQVLVVESPMSVARAVTVGLPNVVATFGAKVSPVQIAQLRQFDTVYVWFDRDAAGINGEKKIVEGLYRHTDVRVITPDGGKDLGDVSGEDEIAFKLNTSVAAPIRLGEYDSYKRARR